MNTRIFQSADRLYDHVVALLGVKARDAADHERIGRDIELAAHPRPALLAEADFLSAQHVGHDYDLLPRHPHFGDRSQRALRDRHHQRGLPGGGEVCTAGDALAQREGDRPPLGPHHRAPRSPPGSINASNCSFL